MIDTIIFPYEMLKTMENLTNEQLAYYISRNGVSEEDFNEGFALLWKRAFLKWKEAQRKHFSL